jgi:hypothetical protein
MNSSCMRQFAREPAARALKDAVVWGTRWYGAHTHTCMHVCERESVCVRARV